MGSNDLALIELEKLEVQLTENKNAELLSDVYMKKASISFNERIKDVPEKYVKKAASLYKKLGDNHGVGRTTALLGRILEKSAKYDEAILILEKSLKLFQKRNSLHGIAGIAKRMVSILIKQGKLDQAWELNQLSAEKAAQMKHHDLIRIAKEHAIIIETKKGNWQLAQILLSQYNADTLDHEKILKQVYSQFMQLDLFMAQNKTDESLSVITDIQDIINKKNYTGLQNKLNFALASYYSMIMQPDQGITLLKSTKQKLHQSDNVEDIIELNNTLAKLYLQNNQASQALSILQEIAQYNPVAYPYLLFKSQAHFVLQNPVKALELAKECKANAFNLWNPKDQKYLNKLSVN
jgi:tetratricopeptide (TPR) repeat protein